jgi:cysteine desulfuration protein SufE
MSIQEKQAHILEDMTLLSEWFDRYDYIIDLGKQLEPMPEEYKTEENIIPGCQSKVWIQTELRGNSLHFWADSDAVITKGLAALLLVVCNDESPASIAEAELGYLDEIGIKNNLSPTRANGFASMVKRIRQQAENYL